MAKNRNNRDRKQPRAERAGQGTQAVLDREEELAPPLATPDEAPRGKRRKRFGHN
ncbi:hypothetical protein [Streptomyces fumanus]|uniref:Small hydrophilic protein n=1 Tax=Streptomyces fumanus TaxID=67302 RepID=A0A919EB64_9ACTN|nr:hypothetical protein [Streptomyces fumanus]GHF32483.1 hypothetical protein GCM10018772_67670 [Streptomyces fumanus]